MMDAWDDGRIGAMRIFAAMTVKDEADIVADVITAATAWADLVIVMDNGSTDGTWEILERLAADDDKVVLWGRFLGRFRDSLRQQIFADFRHLSEPGDWWCRLDADEFYLDDPREFLQALPARTDHVLSASFQFFLTEEDVAREQATGPDYSAMSWYLCNHSEIRFMRHLARTVWPPSAVWPIGLAHPASTRIRLKHYQYRTAQQVEGRIALRAESGPGSTLFVHEKGSAEQWYQSRGFTPRTTRRCGRAGSCSRVSSRAHRVRPDADVPRSAGGPLAPARARRWRGPPRRRHGGSHPPTAGGLIAL